MEDQDINKKLETIVASLIDKSDDEIKSILSSPDYALDEDWQNDILEMVHNAQSDVQDTEALDNALDGTGDFSKDAEAEGQEMADEDNTPVTVTEDDVDGDGDTDKTTVEKEEPENDDTNEDKDNSSETEDKPHDSKVTSDVRMKNIDNSTNSIAKHLANYRW